MKIKKLHWILFSISALISLFLWLKFSYPQFVFLDLSVSKNDALQIAQQYLHQNHYSTDHYKTISSFDADENANKFLQKTIGADAIKAFILQNNFDLFYWKIRTYKEGEPEEFNLGVSPRTGKIIFFHHMLKENAARDFISKEVALKTATQFLKTNFDFNPELFTLLSDSKKKFDNRTDYYFSWYITDPIIFWDSDKTKGSGKIISKITISGNEISSFTINRLTIPDEFNRFIASQRNVGNDILSFIRIFSYILLIGAIYFLVAKKSHFAIYMTSKFYFIIILFSFILSILAFFNLKELYLMRYSTSTPEISFIFQTGIQLLISSIILNAALAMPSLSGELLAFENAPNEKQRGFLYFIKTTFLSKSCAKLILLGYLLCIILLGLQASILKFGQTFLGVWTESNWMTPFSSATFPFLVALTLGFKASFSEEIMFRLFAINWGKKLFKNIFIAILIPSLIWGFSHSAYPVFPQWFRGIEVTLIGILLSIIYLRFGLIPVITAHYLFDVFWSSANYLLGPKVDMTLFISALIVLCLPALFAIYAFIINQPHEEKDIHWHLKKQQLLNLEILKTYIKSNHELLQSQNLSQLRSNLNSGGWDKAVVEVALKDLLKNDYPKNL